MNIHTPERQPGESQADHCARRALSKRINRNLRTVGLGDQHKAPSSREQLRDQQRKNGHLRSGAYGQGLMNAWDRKREREQALGMRQTDDGGSYTLTGRPRRVWLAGISAQRGY